MTDIRTKIAEALVKVTNRWVAPNFPPEHKLREFAELDDREQRLNLDYADAALGVIADAPAAPEPDWQDDPSADERWNAGLDFGQQQLCKYLGVDPDDVTWDAATEELEGDVQAVIGNIMRTKFGDDWSPSDGAIYAAVSRASATDAEHGDMMRAVDAKLGDLAAPPVRSAASTDEPVAYVPVHPRNGELWMDTFPAGRDVAESRSNSYPLRSLYAAPTTSPEPGYDPAFVKSILDADKAPPEWSGTDLMAHLEEIEASPEPERKLTAEESEMLRQALLDSTLPAYVAPPEPDAVREALEPLAVIARLRDADCDEPAPEDETIFKLPGYVNVRITMADCRRALAASRNDRGSQA